MSNGAAIRRATRSDLKACADIVNDYVDDTEWLPRIHSRETTEGFFEKGFDAGREMWVYEAGGRIVGYISAEPKDPPDLPMLHAIYLRPEARREGIGLALLNKTKELFPLGFELTVFEPNVEAQRFYKREGLFEVPEQRDDDTEESVSTLLFRWPRAGQ